MAIRHTVIFTFYDTTTAEQKADVITRLNDMGVYLTRELGVSEWNVSSHIPETFNSRRAHLLQDCVFPNLDALQAHAQCEPHAKVIELTPKVCDWMTIDTNID